MFSELLTPPRHFIDPENVVLGIAGVADDYLKAMREAYIAAETEIPGERFTGPWISARTPEGIVLLQLDIYGQDRRKIIWEHTSIVRVEQGDHVFNQIRNLGDCYATGSFRGEQGFVRDYGPRTGYITLLTRGINELRQQGLFVVHEGEVAVTPLPA